MLSEIKRVRQIQGEGYRRWFSDKFLDLIIWYNDDGENKIHLYKMTPILVSDGVFDNKKIVKKFREESTEIDSNISAFVFDKLIMYQQL